MLPKLLPEIEIEILLRLPSKSLQRFKVVSKAWYHLITHDKQFLTRYRIRCAQRRNATLFLLKRGLDTLHCTLVSEYSLAESLPLPLPRSLLLLEGNASGEECSTLVGRTRPKSVELVNSNAINGVVCVAVYMGLVNGPEVECNMYLWNLSTSETAKVPTSRITGLFEGPPTVVFQTGFGYANEDYKVVRVVCDGRDWELTEVYSLKRNNWRSFLSGIASNTLWASKMCTFVNGFGYWGAYSRAKKDRFFVLGFDFGRESFKRIKVPVACVDGKELKYHSLWFYKGFLAINVLHFAEFDSTATRQYIWVMVDKAGGGSGNNWCKLLNIDLGSGPRRPVVELADERLLMLGEDDGEHVVYCPQSKTENRIGISNFDAVVDYSESLVSFRPLMGRKANTPSAKNGAMVTSGGGCSAVVSRPEEDKLPGTDVTELDH